MFQSLRALPNTVWLLGLVSLFNDSASELVYPLLPLYLASVLMAGPKTLGLIEGLADASGSLLKLFAGVWADRLRSTKYWIVGGYGLAACGRPLLALASSWPLVLILRFSDRIGKGLRTAPRDALLALSVPAEQRGLAFGVHRALDNAGAVIGPLFAAGLLSWGYSIQDILWWTFFPGLIAVGLTLGLREPPREWPLNRPVYSWRLRVLPPVFKRYLSVLALFTMGNASNMFLLLRARELGIAEAQVPLLWALTAATAMLFSTPLSALSDRMGRVPLIVSGWSIYAAVYLLLGLIDYSPGIIWLVFAFYGLFMAATEGVEKALVADLVPKEQLGAAYGWFNLTVGILLLPASLLFGALWQSLGAGIAFGFAAMCAGLAASLLVSWVLRPAESV